MRLTQIKLAGFKSFVDPVAIPVPGQLVGVVGPNGCGKSNIIDAVRWVLGESAAGRLRGESLQDVIFNGSSGRKPVARASVELLFDNREGRAPGQWQPFAEIAVRRVLERNGDSQFFINNLAVRKRDVGDLFLGTGVGARAYGIIEQGMVNRIVEARPEELRNFLEEAAGVSRYRERRKETEGRLGDARINLDRVEDVLRSLDEQIARLTTQAAAAQRYRDLSAELKTVQATLVGLRAYLASEQARTAEIEAAATETAIEAQMSQVRALEADVEALRQTQVHAADELSSRQAAMYAAGAEVARIEQSLQHVQQTRAALDARIRAQQQRESEETERARQLAAAQATVADEIAGAQALAADAARRQHQAESDCSAAESAEAGAQQALGEIASQRQSARSAVQTAESEVRMVGQRLDTIARQLARLESEIAAAAADSSAADDAAADSRLADLQRMLDEQTALGQSLQGEISAREPELAMLRDELTQLTRDLAAAQARAESLDALRRQQGAGLDPWLKTRGLSAAPRLLDGLRVVAGWEAAFEVALGARLQARQVQSITDHSSDELPPTLALIEAGASDARSADASDGLTPLVTRLQACPAGLAASLHAALAGVFCADDLASALRDRGRLRDGESLVCPNGVLVWRHGLLVGGQGGQLSVQADWLTQTARVAELVAARAPLQVRLEDAQVAQRRDQQQWQALQPTLEQTRRELRGLEVAAARRREAQAQAQARRQAITSEQAHLQSDQHVQQDTLLRAQAEVAAMAGEAAAFDASWQDAQTAAAESRATAQSARERRRQAERAAQEAAYRVQTLQSRAAELEASRVQATQRVQQLADELATLRAESAALEDQTLPASLAEAVQARLQSESDLQTAREASEAAVTALRESEQQRMVAEHALTPLREQLATLRARIEAAVLQRGQQLDLLAGMGVAPQAVDVPEDLDEEPLRRRVGRLQRDIEALGDVNLAAIAELAEASERRGFLDAQATDLRAAIGTLEDAIRRIDRDSRERLQHTFDEVNRGLADLFPAMFGGGEARLELTGDEILDAGLHLTAHPPGKRNTSLALLSGGEKALTALALVFALFRLNPAPFCLLDEVDAPLDDSNTERFCQLVRRMSAQTQFLFITHNKVTMEMAAQLVGVTMPEPGVSRVVAVDVAEAVRLAAA